MRYREFVNPGHMPSGQTLFCTYEYLWPGYFKEERAAGPMFLGYDGMSTSSVLDETHPCRGGKYLSGGPFDLRKAEQFCSPASVNGSFDSGLRRWKVSGTVYPIFYGVPVTGFPHYSRPASSESETRDYGAQAWDKFKPGKPEIGLGVFVAELRDLPRMLMKEAYAHRNLGKHYLNAQFGWIPFLKDIRKMFLIQKNMDKIITRLHRNNGKWALRSGSVLSDISVVDTWEHAGNVPVFSPVVWNDISNNANTWCRGQISHSERVWFSGRFKYYIEGLSEEIINAGINSPWNTAVKRLNLERKIMGLTLDPGEVYNALPWSWLVDYFSNAGNVITNVTNGYVDECVAAYAYVMRENIIEAHQTSGSTLNDGSPYEGTITRRSVQKCRVSANPFGFHVSGDLSSRQTAILAALGLSRA